MNKETITHSLAILRNAEPNLGANQPSLERYIHHYLEFYQLNIASCHHQYGYIHTLNGRLFVQRFTPFEHRGTVVVLHGYFDHAGSLSKTIQFLLSLHYRVVCFDLPGHGLSSGERAAISCFSDYVESLSAVIHASLKQEEKPVFFLGHSTGARIGLDYSLKNADYFKKLILISPLFQPYHWKLSKIGLFFASPFIKQIPRRFQKNSSDKKYLQFTSEDPLQEKRLPLSWLHAVNRMMIQSTKAFNGLHSLSFLMIQGNEDTTIDGKYGLRKAMKHFPNGTFVLINEGHHQLLNEATIVRDQTFTIIKKFLASNSFDS